MPTSDASWSGKLRLVGDLERVDHYHLKDTDQCLFLGEYTARAGYDFSTTNQIISNLKKKPSLRGTAQWTWKERAIREVGQIIAQNIIPAALPTLTFVPIPPSNTKTH